MNNFKFKVGDFVKWNGSRGRVSIIFPKEFYGIEVEFVRANGTIEIGYFDSFGRMKDRTRDQNLILLEFDDEVNK